MTKRSLSLLALLLVFEGWAGLAHGQRLGNRTAPLSELTDASADSIAALRTTINGLANRKDHQGATLTVASHDDPQATADYVCDGTDDDILINAAIVAAHGGGGVEPKMVTLLPGTYHISAAINLGGQVALYGPRARIELTSATPVNMIVISWSTGGTVPPFLDGIQLYGWNRAGTVDGSAIVINDAPGESQIRNVNINAWKGWGITSADVDGVQYFNNTIYSDKPCFRTLGSGNVLIGNQFVSADSAAIALDNSTSNTITGNRLAGGNAAVQLRSQAVTNGLCGNTLSSISGSTVLLVTGSGNNISDNVVIPASNSNPAVQLTAASSLNNLTYNRIGGNVTTVNDLGMNNHVVLDTDVEALQDTTSAHNTRILALKDSLIDHQEQISPLKSSDADQDTAITAHRNEISAVHSANANQDTALTNHRSGLTNLRTEDAVQLDSLDEHNTKLSALRAVTYDNFGVLLGAEGYRGEVITGTAGETMIVGHLCYVKSDGKYWRADADSAATMPAMFVATAATGADDSGTFLAKGRFRLDSWNWTIGGILFPSATKGLFTQSAPSGAGDQVQAVGVATSTNEVLFTPYPILVEK